MALGCRKTEEKKEEEWVLAVIDMTRRKEALPRGRPDNT